MAKSKSTKSLKAKTTSRVKPADSTTDVVAALKHVNEMIEPVAKRAEKAAAAGSVEKRAIEAAAAATLAMDYPILHVDGLLELMDMAAGYPDLEAHASNGFRTSIDIVRAEMRKIREGMEAVLAAARSTHPCEREKGGVS